MDPRRICEFQNTPVHRILADPIDKGASPKRREFVELWMLLEDHITLTAVGAIGRFHKDDAQKIFWENPLLTYDGVPYIMIGSKKLECHQGPDRHKAEKRRTALQRQKDSKSDHFYKKQRFLVQNTKKKDCPAKILMKEVIKFPEYKGRTEDKARLFAVMIHIGRFVNGGHYIAYIQFGLNWYRLDDMKVTRVTEDILKEQCKQPYMLFYRTLPRPYI